MDKNKTANELIPELILKINKYSSKLKDRVKIDSIFREFDSHAQNNFKHFIKMSEKRYKGVKSGNCIRNILSKQKQECDELSNKILSNNLYLDNNIEKENKKLYKKTKNKENKELYQIRRNIIEKTKDFTAKELKNRKKYSSLRDENKKEKKEEQKDNKLNKLDWKYKIPFNKSNISKSIAVIKKRLKLNETENDEDEMVVKKNFFNNLIKKDTNNINSNISDYKEFLKDVEKSKEKDINKIIINGSFGHHYSFKIEDIKLLSYKEEKKEDVKVNKKYNPEIDIVKLIRYTRRGNKKWFQKNLKLRSKNRINSFKKKFNNKKSSSVINIREKKYIKDKSDDKYEVSDINTMGMTSTTAFSNFRNTIKTVKNEAEMIKYLDQNFDRKRKTMEGFFKRNALPSIEDYDVMFKTKDNFKNMNKINENLEKNENNLNENINLKRSCNSLNNVNCKDHLIKADIYESFKKAYNDKKIEWAEEDIQKEKIKQKEKELIEKTNQYLKEIKKVKRNAQLYVDPYSKRDELINNRIKLFTRSLSGPLYSKKMIQSKLDDFNNFIELKEIEKKKNDENFAKTLKEEELKRREEDEEFKLMMKIKKNLEKENMNNDDDIKLNYKFISTLKMCKNDDKDKPYKDYQEFYEIVKDKKRSGEYNLCDIKNYQNDQKEKDKNKDIIHLYETYHINNQ